ncbi:MAG: hypothetical protein PVF75_04655 [Granulosicoccaceae bacterium]|jgi:hypothetical protein
MMLLDNYEQGQLLFNVNFKEKASADGVYGYRGELVLVPGEVTDDQGRTKPPLAVVRSVVLLEQDDKIQFFVGILDELELIKTFIVKYKKDFASDIKILMYVVNITGTMQTEIDGIPFTLIPLKAGVAWNELIDELAMEKSDFKGQSAADKIVTAYEAYKDYTPKYETVAADDAYSRIADIKRELIGAV